MLTSSRRGIVRSSLKFATKELAKINCLIPDLCRICCRRSRTLHEPTTKSLTVVHAASTTTLALARHYASLSQVSLLSKKGDASSQGRKRGSPARGERKSHGTGQAVSAKASRKATITKSQSYLRARKRDLGLYRGEIDENKPRQAFGQPQLQLPNNPGTSVDGSKGKERLQRSPFIRRNEGYTVFASLAKRDKAASNGSLSRILADKTRSLEDAWSAFQDLHDGEADTLDANNLETLAHRIIQARPRTRLHFFRLLSVLSRLRQQRLKIADYPSIRTKEWNALIHFAGSGLRKTTPEAYNAALDVYDDMLRSIQEERNVIEQNGVSKARTASAAEPDIYTYTTLLNIAVKSVHRPAIEHATNMLKSAQLEPTRVTYLCTLPFRFREEGFLGIRALMSTLVNEGHNVDIDGVNAYVTCAGKERRLDIVKNLYRALRRNLQELQDTFANVDVNESRSTEMAHWDDRFKGLEGYSENDDGQHWVEGVMISRDVIPNEITYTFIIQTFAYSGQFLNAMEAFTDMLSTRRAPPESGFFQPSYPILRAFFLAYSRYALQMSNVPPYARHRYARQSGWTWERLQILLDAFFELENCNPSARVVYWIVMSVKWTTGNNEEITRSVWLKLNQRFKFRKGGRLTKLDKWYSVPEDEWKARWFEHIRQRCSHNQGGGTGL